MAFFVSPLLPFFSLLVIPLMNLQVNALGSSSLKPRSKRSYHHRHSAKLSIKDLALELAKKHVSSINKLDSTLSTTVNGPKPSLPLQFQFSWNVFCLILIYNLPYLLVSRPFYHDHLLGIFSGGGCPLLILRPNLSRKGQKKLFIDRPPQLSQGLDDRPPPPLPIMWRSGSATELYLGLFSFQCGNKISRLCWEYTLLNC